MDAPHIRNLIRKARAENDTDALRATNELADLQAQAHSTIDWPAEARKAAIALLASGDYDADGACIGAEALIAEMKRREAFGGGG